jgi:hypothetical protein
LTGGFKGQRVLSLGQALLNAATGSCVIDGISRQIISRLLSIVFDSVLCPREISAITNLGQQCCLIYPRSGRRIER